LEKSTDVTFDVELSASDVQSLNSADPVAGLFARLGYNVNERTEQLPGNLGITADGTVRPIRRIELIANQEGLLQVYLFELTSVTIAQTRALARVFRNRAGNYLLVLTSDYESLDFVLLEKYLPPEGNGGSSLAARQIGIRPRVLTINRRKPRPVQLRVLRRFTWTESDPFAQYEKLLSAYSVADWSEEHFNNRALFSDYYLKERLKGLPEWSEDPKPSYRQLRDFYLGAASKFANKEENSLRKGLLEPALTILGFVAEAGKHSASGAADPDYRLYSSVEVSDRSKKTVRALCLAYPWGRSLDGKDDQRDRETPDENPGASVVSVLEKGEAAWVIVTNGKLWRLYSQHTRSRATNYYEIDLEEALAITSSGTAQVDESFRYFWLLFRCQAFEPAQVRRDGKEEKLSFLDRLRAESEDYAKELGDRLKKRVFEQIFPHLAVGFITYIQARDDKEPQLSEETLRTVRWRFLVTIKPLAFARCFFRKQECRRALASSSGKVHRQSVSCPDSPGQFDPRDVCFLSVVSRRSPGFRPRKRGNSFMHAAGLGPSSEDRSVGKDDSARRCRDVVSRRGKRNGRKSKRDLDRF
jgi:hypothetical protein